jgi:hypothetical protein
MDSLVGNKILNWPEFVDIPDEDGILVALPPSLQVATDIE